MSASQPCAWCSLAAAGGCEARVADQVLLVCGSAGAACVQGLSIDDKSAAKLKATADELIEERQLALECIGEAH